MPAPLRALKLDPSAIQKPRSRRRRAVTSASFVGRPSASEQEQDHREGADLLMLLEDALARIAETTSDPATREIAEDTLALSQGR
jgi:hypothetical protein